MSKIDELHETYCLAVKAYMNSNGGALIWDAERAGIAAVVRALRDEFSRAYNTGYNDADEEQCPTGPLVADRTINRILGDAGEKVAEDPLPHLSEREKALFVAALKGDAGPITPPATDPAPAPCLWRVHHETRNGPLYVSQCDGEWRHATADPKCPSCGKPIKFTEAK